VLPLIPEPIMTEPRTAATAEPEAPRAPRSLGEWVEMLSERGMPAFARTVEQISGVAGDRESSAAELAAVVLQDAAMTARLLRIANSPLYNLTGKHISTVSRAVVMLGFNTVRSLCLSIAVVESVAEGAHKERLAADMARCFHAAVQARAFAEQRKDPAPEEVFIATLLRQLGQLAFWSYGSAAAERLDAELEVPGTDADAAARALLGFDLSELSLGLSRQWKLGDLLIHALEGRGDDDPRVSNVELAHELARLAEQEGWDSEPMRKLMARLAETLYMPLRDLTELVHDNASRAARTAACFGAGKAVERIPLPRASKLSATEAAARAERVPEFPEPDPMLQLRILRELSALLEGEFNINLVLEMVLEGIFRGVGMDRTLFALLTADRGQLVARYALGQQAEELRTRFRFPISAVQANIWFHVIDSRQALTMDRQADPRLQQLLTPEVRAVIGDGPFLAMPIEVQGKVIGLFYADRHSSGRPLDEEACAAFRHFGSQANLALSHARR